MRVARWIVAAVAAVAAGCGGGGSSTVQCPTGGGKMHATFGDIIGANTMGDAFDATYVLGMQSGSLTTVLADSDENVNCTGLREVRLCVPEVVAAGKSYSVGDCTAATSTMPVTAQVGYNDARAYGTSSDNRDWWSTSGTFTVTAWGGPGTRLDFTFSATMGPLLANVIPQGDSTRGTFTLDGAGSVDPFPTP